MALSGPAVPFPNAPTGIPARPSLKQEAKGSKRNQSLQTITMGWEPMCGDSEQFRLALETADVLVFDDGGICQKPSGIAICGLVR